MSNLHLCSAKTPCRGMFKVVDSYLTTLQLPSERDEISQEERLLLIKQDTIFRNGVSFKTRYNTHNKMNQNLLPASGCQQSIETIQESTKTVLSFDGRINSDGIANKFEGSYGSVAQRHSKTANALFIDGHVERIQDDNSDGTTNEGRSKQPGRTGEVNLGSVESEFTIKSGFLTFFYYIINLCLPLSRRFFRTYVNILHLLLG